MRYYDSTNGSRHKQGEHNEYKNNRGYVMSEREQEEKQGGVNSTAFNQQARLVIYAENKEAVEIAKQIVKSLKRDDVCVQIRAAAAPLPPGSWGC